MRGVLPHGLARPDSRAGLAVLWLILGSHALFFTAGTAILYSAVLPIVMMRSIDATGVSVLVKRQLVMMGKPDMASVSLTGTGTRSPLRYDATLCLPPYLVKKHERYSHPGLMVFFEAIAARDAYRSLVSAVKTEIEIKRASHSRVITIK